MRDNKSYIEKKIERLYSSELISEKDIFELECLLNNSDEESEVSQYFKDNWEEAKKTIQMKKRQRANHVSLAPLFSLATYKNIAAVLLLPLLGTFLWFVLSNNEADSKLMSVKTEMGDRAHFYLPDGTEVFMNAMSTLSYDMAYASDNRNVKIIGEAFFKVQKNKTLPFVVQTDSLTIEALGTQFIVRNHNDEAYAEALLVEGSIEVNDCASSLILVPGEAIEYEKAKLKMTKKTFNRGLSLAWTKGQLYFSNDGIDQVVRKIEHWYGVKVIYNSKEFNSETLTLKMRKEETLYNLLAVVSEAMHLNYRMVNDEIIIKKRK